MEIKKGLKDTLKSFFFPSLRGNYILILVSRDLNCDAEFYLRGNFAFSPSLLSTYSADGAGKWYGANYIFMEVSIFS